MRLPSLRPPRKLGHGEEATLVEHLEELRHRLFYCIGALVVGFVVAYVFHRHLIHALEQALPRRHRRLTTLTIGEPFMTSLWLSVYAGFILALPVIIWQAWAFFLPAFEEKHERMLKIFVLISVALLAIGIAFGYFVALPKAAHFPNLEDPYGLAEALLDWLDETEPGLIEDSEWGQIVGARSPRRQRPAVPEGPTPWPSPASGSPE